MVSPGEAFGRRSNAWGDALRTNGTIAGVPASMKVRARDVVGNAIMEGGSELVVYAFHREVEVLPSKIGRLVVPTIYSSRDTHQNDDGGGVGPNPASLLLKHC